MAYALRLHAHYTPDHALAEAERLMAEALPPAQRARLDARLDARPSPRPLLLGERPDGTFIDGGDATTIGGW